MISLKNLLKGISYISSHDEERINNTFLNDICYDSRNADEKKAFIAIKGESVDGHNYINAAYGKGCRVFIVEDDIKKDDFLEDVIIIKTINCRIALANMSKNLFKLNDKLKIIGVTGTKGKTTIANLIFNALNKMGKKCGCIGTNGIFYNDKKIYSKNTTPESYELYKIFNQMVMEDIEYVVMEVSSLGVKMNRIYGIDFCIGIFVNLSPDHIGPKEHKDFNEYKLCKLNFFNQCKKAIINVNDEYSKDFIEFCNEAKVEVKTFGYEKNADVIGENAISFSTPNILGTEFTFLINNIKYNGTIIQPGIFSVLNNLAVITTLYELSFNIDIIISTIKDISVKGRMEIIKGLDYCRFIIDYAHNKLSFENLFKTLLPYKNGRLIAVFGSVGERTFARRKELACLSAEYCDYVIITSDNPNFEEPNKIVDEISDYLPDGFPYYKEADREKAVRYAVNFAKENDIIVFCGKGHEDYQLINGENVPFNEKEIILDECKNLKIVKR